MVGSNRIRPCRIIDQEYPSISDTHYLYIEDLERTCIVQDVKRIPFKVNSKQNQAVVKVLDYFGDGKIHKFILPYLLETAYEPYQMYNFCSLHHIVNDLYVCNTFQTKVSIPHVVIFRGNHDYRHWINGIMLSLISNDLITCPLFHLDITMDEFYAIIDMFRNGNPERDNYEMIVKQWNDDLPEFTISPREMPDYNYGTLGTIRLQIAPPI